MNMCGKKELPQGSTNLLTDSDRVKAPVVSAGPKDFEEDKTHKSAEVVTEQDRKKTMLVMSALKEEIGEIESPSRG